jgi:hypothetical protein
VNAVITPIRWWVRLYTAGLPAQTRDDRRAEIESDLWEETRFAAEHDLHRLSLALSVWSRWLLGVADDVMWRAEQRASLRDTPRQATGRSSWALGTSPRRLLGLGAGAAIAITVVSLVVVVNTIEYNDGTQPTRETAAILLALVAAIAGLGGVTAARGFWIMAARPAEGVILVVAGSFVAGLVWYWLYLPVILAMLVSVYGVSRAMRRIDGAAGP